MQSIPQTIPVFDLSYTNQLVNNTDRDVLDTRNIVVDSVKTGLNSVDRDILQGHNKINENVNIGLNSVDRDIIQGHNKINENVKNGQFFVDNDVMINREKSSQGFAKIDADIAKGNYYQTTTLKDTLAGIDKDIYKSAHQQNEHQERQHREDSHHRRENHNTSRDYIERQFLATGNTASRYQSDLVAQATASTLALSLATKDTQLAISANKGEIESNFQSLRGFVRNNALELQSEQQKLSAIQQLQSQSQYSSALLEQLKSKDQLQQQISHTEMQSQKQFGKLHEGQSTSTLKLELDAQRNKAEVMSLIQKCCCEQKENTRMTGEKTDTLIRQLEQTNLRDKLQESRAINIANAFNSAAANVIHSPVV
jgi:hypothetical protein